MAKMITNSKSVKVTMYSGTDDPDLPDQVKSLPDAVRARWLNNYNWCVIDCQDDADAEEMADEQTMMSVDEMGDMMPMGAAKGSDGAGDSEADEAVIDSKAVLTAKKRGSLSKGQFAYVDENGKGHLPIHDAPHVRNALARFDQTQMPDSAKAGAMRKIMAAAKRMGVDAASKKEAQAPSWIDRLKAWASGPPVLPSNLEMFGLKQAPDGRLHAMLVYSNIFKDKEGEIFSEAAHKEYEAALDTGQAPYPELHIWHGGPDTRWGAVETMTYVDGFAVAGGVVDPGKEHVALKLKELADKGEIAVSHGYVGLRGSDGVYQLYRSFELSPLPVGSESNPWTTADPAIASKENDMAWSDKKKAWFKQYLSWDDSTLASAEAKFGEMTNALKSAGVDWKEADDPAPVATVAAAPVVATVAPAPAPVQDMGPLVELVNAVKSMADGLVALQTEVTALKAQDSKTVEQRAQDQVMAQITSAGAGFSPANSPNNIAQGMKEAADRDWFDQAIAGVFTAPEPSVAIGQVNGEVK